MTYNYTLEAQDFITFQLYTASNSNRINRKKKRSWLFLTVAFAIITFYNYHYDYKTLSLYFGVITILCVLFYPNYYKWKQNRHYKRFTFEHNKNSFGRLETITFNKKHLLLENTSGTGKINLTEFEGVDEIGSHYFMKMTNGASLIIPKSQINTDSFINEIKKLKLLINSNLNWKW